VLALLAGLGLVGCGDRSSSQAQLHRPGCLYIQPTIYDYMHARAEPAQDRAVAARLLATIDRHPAHVGAVCSRTVAVARPTETPPAQDPLCAMSGFAIRRLISLPTAPQVHQAAVAAWDKLKQALTHCS
jgi:hypothetical protein